MNSKVNRPIVNNSNNSLNDMASMRENNVNVMNQALIQEAQNRRSVPTHSYSKLQKVSKTLVINNDIAIRKKTVRLIPFSSLPPPPSSQSPPSYHSPSSYSLSFTYDSFKECEIGIYLFHEEKKDLLTQLTKDLVSHRKDAPPLVNMYPHGLNVPFPRVINVDFGKYPEEVVFNHKDDYYPLIIRITKNWGDERKNLYSYLTFVREDKEIVAKFIRQKMEINDQAFEIQEIYGLTQSSVSKEDDVAQIEDTEKECVICCSDKIDTIIMPCRHMCLCLNCAESFQSSNKPQTKKCPICRKNIESFIRLQRAPNQQQTNPINSSPPPSHPPSAQH